MSAPELREAASLTRERAENATPGPWEARHGGYSWIALYDDEDKIPEGESLPSFEPGGSATPADAEHIASWHPAVAPYVAAWLDSEADRLAELTHAIPNVVVSAGVLREWGFGHALDVARAYLGGAS